MQRMEQSGRVGKQVGQVNRSFAIFGGQRGRLRRFQVRKPTLDTWEHPEGCSLELTTCATETPTEKKGELFRSADEGIILLSLQFIGHILRRYWLHAQILSLGRAYLSGIHSAHDPGGRFGPIGSV